jgi:arylsulfatase A-like enzyme
MIEQHPREPSLLFIAGMSALVGGLTFFAEALWLVASGGGFVHRHLALTFTLLRYLIYGGLVGVGVGALLLRLGRRISCETPEILAVSVVSSIFFGLELVLYLFDIVVPLQHAKHTELLILPAVVLASAIVLAWAAYFSLRRVRARLGAVFSAWRSTYRVLGLLSAWVVLLLGPRGFAAIVTGRTFDGTSPTKGRPNVLLVVLDTVRADALSASGNPSAETPHFDRLAAEGILFRHAVSASTWTPPGHASLFTGLPPVSHGTRGPVVRLAEDLAVLPAVLKEAGYATLSLYNNPLVGRDSGMTRGFGVAIGVETDDKASFLDQRLRYKYWLRDSGVRRTLEVLQSWVEECAERGVPWFAFVNLNDAHSPYVPRQPWIDIFTKRLGVENADVDFELVRRIHRRASGGRVSLNPGSPEMRWLRAAYYSEVREMDEHIGRLLEELSQRGLLDNTIILITSDHGEAFGEEGFRGHGNDLAASVVRIPLILWAPRLLDPRVDDRWASLVDVLPTLLDLLQIDFSPQHYRLAGTSLISSARGDEAYAEHTGITDESCSSFLRLNGDKGWRLSCRGDVSEIDGAKRGLSEWTSTPMTEPLVGAKRAELAEWRRKSLRNKSPLRRPGAEPLSASRERLRALGYQD